MSIEILTTKILVPPLTANLVSRPLLIDRLNDGVGRKLTLISAPAGFGKTSLLGQWRVTDSGSGSSTAWVSLDEDDNDPVRFFTYVIAALQRLHPGIGTTALALIESPEPRPETKSFWCPLFYRSGSLAATSRCFGAPKKIPCQGL